VPLKTQEHARLKALGARIRRERMAKGMTQESLAELAQISTRNLQKVEAGELNILTTTLMRIQLGLRCPWKRLMPPE
jgi:transcriptional regulator with XRE-family HTH domain